MSMSSEHYRSGIRDFLNDGNAHLLRLRPFRNARTVAEKRHIAEVIVRMTDEELDRMRDHLTPPGQRGHGTGGYSYSHPPPAWMDDITRGLLGVPAKMTDAQA